MSNGRKLLPRMRTSKLPDNGSVLFVAFSPLAITLYWMFIGMKKMSTYKFARTIEGTSL